MKKELRQEVHLKYCGKCAYCGKDIQYKDMQVDHIIPESRFFRFLHRHKNEYKVDDFINLNPACRVCNHYKRVWTVEEFRSEMLTLHKRAAQQYLFKIALDYGMATIKPFDGVFYFEKGKSSI